MTQNIPQMIHKGRNPLMVISINGKYILAAYQGKFSQYDLLLGYRQKDNNGKWSRIRTPKHIHWTVDILIKMHSNKEVTNNFLDFLIKEWEKITPINSDIKRNNILDSKILLDTVNNEAKNYTELSNKGEYSINFLILIARLLMYQEKTNRTDAYMFKNLLHALKDGKNIFEIVNIATFKRK